MMSRREMDKDIELKTLLKEEDKIPRGRNSQDIEEAIPHGSNDKVSEEPPLDEGNTPEDDGLLIKTIEWKGHLVRVFPLDYQKVRLVKYQIVSCLLMFMVFGFNDQSTGSLIPTLVEDYDISAVMVSNIFLVQLFGYTSASLLNERIHHHFGMKGGMFIAATLCIVFFTILAMKPPNFFVYLLCSLPLGLGIGILDASGNVLMGNLIVHKNEWMGAMHAIYGCAAMLTPPLVSHFVEWNHWPLFFMIPLVISVIGMIFIVPSFRYETAVKYDYTCNRDTDKEDGSHSGDTASSNQERESFFELLKTPTILLYAIFLFLYLGAEITTGAWFFTFLLETKLDNKIKMSYVASAFWIGLTVGRLVLGFVTKRAFVNEYRASRFYGLVTIAFYVLFTLVGTINSHATGYFVLLFVIVFGCGFFIGPLFPSASIVALQVLPARLHISGVGIAVAVGGCGGAALPYLAGVIIHMVGIQYMPLMCTIMVTFFVGIWALYPRYIKGYDEYL